MTSKIAWLIDIDTLEYVPGEEFDLLLNGK
jgi:hypothetical protein